MKAKGHRRWTFTIREIRRRFFSCLGTGKRTRAEIDEEYDKLEKEEEALARLVTCRHRKRKVEEERKTALAEE